MLGVLGIILAGGAIAAFGVAVYSFGQLVQLMPKGARLSGIMSTGWWQFDKIAEQCGPAAHPHVRRYIMATLAFLLCVIAGIGLTIVLAASEANGTSQAETRPINDPRVLAARHELAALPAQTLFLLPLRQES